jgi:hypothetical protein
MVAKGDDERVAAFLGIFCAGDTHRNALGAAVPAIGGNQSPCGVRLPTKGDHGKTPGRGPGLVAAMRCQRVRAYAAHQ